MTGSMGDKEGDGITRIIFILGANLPGGGGIQACIIQNKYKYSIMHDTRADRLYFHALTVRLCQLELLSQLRSCSSVS